VAGSADLLRNGRRKKAVVDDTARARRAVAAADLSSPSLPGEGNQVEWTGAPKHLSGLTPQAKPFPRGEGGPPQASSAAVAIRPYAS